ncbi:MAG TPA: universal stress protein [Hyphomicrobiaceae bacterium]|jgi:nucleotide-binding universal stress UspA family protein
MLHLLLATDGSSGADRAIDFAARLAKEMGGKLSILTVGGNLSGVDKRELARAESGIGDALEAVSEQILERARRRAHEAGAPDIGVHAGWGDPAEVIIEVARRDQVDAIVMGRRGRGRLTGMLLGSVSQKIASLAPCVVILVP